LNAGAAEGSRVHRWIVRTEASRTASPPGRGCAPRSLTFFDNELEPGARQLPPRQIRCRKLSARVLNGSYRPMRMEVTRRVILIGAAALLCAGALFAAFIGNITTGLICY